MRSFVIAIVGHQQSMRVAERCIRSGRVFDLEIEIYPAITPEDDLPALLSAEGIHYDDPGGRDSHEPAAIACFLSHYFLWKRAAATNEKINIFEHDAVLLDHMPDCNYQHAINWGAPSYGRWKKPELIRVNPLTTKKYFPGAHAYGVTPEGAKLFINHAQVRAMAVDCYLSTKNFPSLQEYYPFIAEARDHFTTIQKRRFCTAKHRYNDDFEYIPNT